MRLTEIFSDNQRATSSSAPEARGAVLLITEILWVFSDFDGEWLDADLAMPLLLDFLGDDFQHQRRDHQNIPVLLRAG